MTIARNNKEHSTKISMTTMSILDKRWSVFLSQTRHARVQLVINSKKLNKLKTKCKTLHA